GPELEAESAQERDELLELVLVGPLVHAVKPRDLVAAHALRGLDVRRDHALLDDLVRHDTLDGAYVADLAALVELDLHLGQVEVDRAAALACLRERAIDVVEPIELLLALRVTAVRPRGR